jgi:hypothetical protein
MAVVGYGPHDRLAHEWYQLRIIQMAKLPDSFTGWIYVSDNPRSKHCGEVLVVADRNATDSSYYNAIALDGTCPAVAESKLLDLFRAGKLQPPAS